MDMTSIMALSWGGKVAAAMVAVALLFFVLRRLDKRAGLDFKEFANDLRDAPQAAALYFGLRYLGSALLVGLVIAFS